MSYDFFPYPKFRPSQKEIIQLSRRAVRESKHFIFECATGVGKTAAVLAGILPEVKEKGLNVIYCVRAHSQMNVVLNELDKIREEMDVFGIPFISRKRMCINKRIKDPDYTVINETCKILKKRCPYYFKNKNERIDDFIDELIGTTIHFDEIYKIGKSLNICPYELQKRLLPYVDLITCHYLYLFNPVIRRFWLERYFALEDCFLVLDEVHNLPAIAVDINSDYISRITLHNALFELNDFQYMINKQNDQTVITDFQRKNISTGIKSIKMILKHLLSEGKAISERLRVGQDHEIDFLAKNFDIDDSLEEITRKIEIMINFGTLIKNEMVKLGKNARSYIFKIGRFLEKWIETLGKKEYAHIFTKINDDNFHIELLSLDPEIITKEIFETVAGSVCMSGTLRPANWLVDLCGIPAKKESLNYEDRIILREFSSPYKKQHILTILLRGVTTKFQTWSEKQVTKYIEKIVEIVDHTPKNTGVFCASYRVLEDLLKQGLKEKLEKLDSVKVFTENRNMASKESIRMVREFKNYSKIGKGVLLGVMGGRNSEGVDYPGNEMLTAAIIGVPFSERTNKLERQIEYMDKKFGDRKGEVYGYNLPAIRKAIQAAGRPIRSFEEIGVIIFLDWRYGLPKYNRFFPKWMSKNLVVFNTWRSSKHFLEMMDDFFSKNF